VIARHGASEAPKPCCTWKSSGAAGAEPYTGITALPGRHTLLLPSGLRNGSLRHRFSAYSRPGNAQRAPGGQFQPNSSIAIPVLAKRSGICAPQPCGLTTLWCEAPHGLPDRRPRAQPGDSSLSAPAPIWKFSEFLLEAELAWSCCCHPLTEAMNTAH